LEKRLNGVNQYDVKRVITKATWAEIRTAYASGIGLREIARNMDIQKGRFWSAKALAKSEDAERPSARFKQLQCRFISARIVTLSAWPV
jgi:hypothetical protein